MAAKMDLRKLLEGFREFGWNFHEQNSSGRLFLTRDFQPAHLRVIYDICKNDIVNHYLDGRLEKRMPKLIISPLVSDL
jgi:hypothetical protein